MDKRELLKYIKKNRLRIKTTTKESKELLLLQNNFSRKFLPDKSGYYYIRDNGMVRFWADPSTDVYTIMVKMKDLNYYILAEYRTCKGFVKIANKFRIKIPRA